jgi:hypothetical protein
MNGSSLVRLLRRIQSKLLFIPATLHLLVAIRGRRATELWIGDSHAMSANHDIVSSMFMRGSNGELILRAGAKLMYSVARDGWPPRIMRVVRLIGPFVRPGSIIPVFSAGEIDVRAHLSGRPEQEITFAPAYVERCEAIARQLKADLSGYLVPPPPCTRAPDEVWFPMAGTLEAQVASFRQLRLALADALHDVPHARLLDFTSILADPWTGGIRPEFTDDGVHTNLAAVREIRAMIEQAELLTVELSAPHPHATRET